MRVSDDTTQALAIEFAKYISSHYVFEDYNLRTHEEQVEIYEDFLKIREIQKNKLI